MKTFLLAGVAAIALAPAAHAVTVSASQSIQTTLAAGGSPVEIFLPKFDPSLGNLQSVFFISDGTISGSIAGDDDTNNAEGTSIQSTVTASFGSGGFADVIATPISQAGVEVTGRTGSQVNFAPGLSEADASFTDPADLAFFTGTGDFSFFGSAGALQDIPDGSINGLETVASTITIANQVVYTFEEIETPTPIPLPAAAWMLLAGIGSLWAFRRRTHA